MRSHLEDAVLLDVIEGAASVEATRHAAQCAECARRADEARAGLALAAGAEAPEPSPLFWEAFRRRVSASIEAEPRPRRFPAFFAPALLAASVIVAAVIVLPGRTGTPALSPAPLAAASSVPAVADDPALDAASASAEEFECRDVAACVAGLTDEETRDLADALRAELAESGDL